MQVPSQHQLGKDIVHFISRLFNFCPYAECTHEDELSSEQTHEEFQVPAQPINTLAASAMTHFKHSIQAEV